MNHSLHKKNVTPTFMSKCIVLAIALSGLLFVCGCTSSPDTHGSIINIDDDFREFKSAQSNGGMLLPTDDGMKLEVTIYFR